MYQQSKNDRQGPEQEILNKGDNQRVFQDRGKQTGIKQPLKMLQSYPSAFPESVSDTQILERNGQAIHGNKMKYHQTYQSGQ